MNRRAFFSEKKRVAQNGGFEVLFEGLFLENVPKNDSFPSL
jgi:hypothetical protein